MDNGEKTQDLPKPRPVSPINGQPVPNGRKKGVPNKVTTEFKEGLAKLFDYAAPDMVEWLKQIDSPERRFEVLAKFADYLFPKLARTEIDHSSTDGSMRPQIPMVVLSDGKELEFKVGKEPEAKK